MLIPIYSYRFIFLACFIMVPFYLERLRFILKGYVLFGLKRFIRTENLHMFRLSGELFTL